MAGVQIPITGDSTSLVQASAQGDAALAKLAASMLKAAAADKEKATALGVTVAQLKKLEAELATTTAAATKAAVATDQVTKATVASAGGADRALKALGPLGGVLSRLDPSAGAVASSIAGLTSATEGLTVGAGALGISLTAVAALAAPVAAGAALISAAYLALTGNLDDVVFSLDAVEARNKAAAETATKTAGEVNAINALRLKLQDQVLIASGNETSATQAQRKTVEEINAAYTDQIAIRKAAVDAATKAGDGSVTAAKRALAATEAEKQGLIDLAAQAATLKPHDAKADAAAAAKRAADEKAAQALEIAGAKNRTAILSAARKEDRRGEKAYSDMVIKDAADQAAADKKLVDKQIADAKRLADERKAASDQRLADEQAVAGAIANLGSQLVTATTKQYDTTTKAGRAAALKQFETQKAANLAIGAINTAVAVSTALKDYPVPPLSIVMGGLALASGIVAEAAIAAAPAPKFHAGKRPDEINATLQRGEAVVSAQGMSKPGMKAAVAAANGGYSPGGGGGPVSVVYLHKVHNEFMRDSLAQGGPLTRRMDQGVKVGHRTRRNSNV